MTVGGGDLRLEEVYLSGSTGHGPAVVGGLALVADGHGLTVLGPQPSSVRTMPWGRVSTMACQQVVRLPDGRGAVVLEVEIEGQALKFLVPEAGSGGAGVLEGRLSTLARVPVRAPEAARPVASNGYASPGGSAPPGVVAPVPVLPAGGAGEADSPGAQHSGVFAPPTGGTLLGGLGEAAQQYVQVGARHPGRNKRLAVVLVLVLAVGGAGAFLALRHKGSSSAGLSADSLIAAQVNLAPGQLPGWKGIAGTTAGVLGAYGLRSGPVTGGASVSQEAASQFARCTGSPVAESDAAIASLGFPDGSAPVGGETDLGSSPLYEDPGQAPTSVESSVLVLASRADQVADMSAFTRPGFAPCYARYLDAIVPQLVGGSMSGTPFRYADVTSSRARPAAGGIETVTFDEMFVEPGAAHKVALTGSVDVIGGGRTIAVLETLASRQFPLGTALKLFSTVEQNVSGESS